MHQNLLSLSLFLLSTGVVPAAPQGNAIPDRAALEAEFEKQMSGSQMVGRFITSGSDRTAQPDSYTISKVTKVKGDDWRFDVKIEYAGLSVTVPLVVQVIWAGDTPMIQVTELAVPMLGTFSARVAIYGDEYAGLWSGGDHGGQMYGKIEADSQGNGSAPSSDEPSWASWRGPLGIGVAPTGNPPIEWSEDKNIRWKVPIPGLGLSSPIVLNDRIYVTTSIETERDGAPPQVERTGAGRGDRGRGGRRRRGGRGGGGGMGGATPTKIHEFVVLALDRADGSVVWRTTVAEALPHEAGHPTGSLASNSPWTDGEHIIVSFGSRGLHCLNMAGEIQWSKQFDPMKSRGGFGEGSSPGVYGDTVVLQYDHEGDSFIAAFEKSTGQELWRTAREEGTSWSTPLIAEVDGLVQVITAATNASRSYDLRTGEVIWSLPGLGPNVVSMPILVGDIVYLMSGYQSYHFQAVRLSGARGDLTGQDKVLWSYDRNTSFVPSALVYDDFVYFFRGFTGVLTCLNVNTGEVHYEGSRIGLRQVYSSPVGVAGRVYLTSREGITKVIKLGGTYEELATNQLDDAIDASAAIVGDELFLRGRANLYCIANTDR